MGPELKPKPLTSPTSSRAIGSELPASPEKVVSPELAAEPGFPTSLVLVSNPKQVPPSQGHLMQRPIYFISEVLRDAKAQYSQVQKVLYAVLIALRKL